SRSLGAPVLRLECLNPSILKTERPPVTCARSNSYCGRRNRPTAPPGPSRRAGSFIGTLRTWSSYWAMSGSRGVRRTQRPREHKSGIDHPERTFLCRPVGVERTTQIGSASEAKSDGLTHPGRGRLKWQIAARPLTVY